METIGEILVFGDYGEILVFGDYWGDFSVWRLLGKLKVKTIGEIESEDYWGNFSVWRLLGKF